MTYSSINSVDVDFDVVITVDDTPNDDSPNQWVEYQAGVTTIAAGRKYFLKGLARETVTLPSTAQNGQSVVFMNVTSAGFRITTGTQKIRLGDYVTKSGGYVDSQAQGTYVILEKASDEWIMRIASGYVFLD